MYASVQIVDEAYAVFSCNHCNHCNQVVRIESSDVVRDSSNKFQLTCTCGHLHESVIEYRASMRKKTNIPGIYKVIDENGIKKSGSMTVINISWQGFKLKISGYEHGIMEHDLNSDRYKQECHDSQSIFVNNMMKVGNRINMEFFLDDPKMSFISRPVIIKWLRQDSVGVELCDPDAFEPSIRFYLLGLIKPY